MQVKHRHAKHWLLIVAASACIAGAADAGNGRLRERIQQRLQSRTVERAALPAGTRRLADLAYGSDPAQRLDVYVPAHPSGRILVMVHGGGWRRGDKAMPAVVQNKLAHWGARGDVLVSVDYRLLPTGPLQQAEDVAAALAYVQRHAREWGGDPGNLVLMGHSAGAHLAALLSADPSRYAGLLPWRGTVLLDSAALDVPALMRAPHPALYDDAFGRDATYWRDASPQQRLNRHALPMLLVCSSQRQASCTAAHAYADAAKALGIEAQVLPQALTHGEINANLGLPGAYTDAVDAFLAALPPR